MILWISKYFIEYTNNTVIEIKNSLQKVIFWRLLNPLTQLLPVHLRSIQANQIDTF